MVAPAERRALRAVSARRWPGCTWRARDFRCRGQRAVGRGLAAAVRRGRAARRRACSLASRDFLAARARRISRRTGRATCRTASSMPTCFPTTSSSSATSCPASSTSTFACNDILAYDVAICLNAWCFEPDHSFNVTKARALLDAYGGVRSSSEAEQDALPLLARGAAMRFLLTRLVDWLNVPPGALVRPKDPLEYVRKLRFHRVNSVRDYGLSPAGLVGVSSLPNVGDLYRRRLLGQSRARRLGRDPELRRRREGIEGRRAAHHQQPHGADGGDLGAGGAEEAVHGRPLHRQPICAAGHHQLDPRLEEERLAHRGQEAGQERRTVATPRGRAKTASGALALGQGPCRP